MDKKVCIGPTEIPDAAWENLENGRTVTGLDEVELPWLFNSALTSYLEMYRNTLMDYLIAQGYEGVAAHQLLTDACAFKSVGDFLYDAAEQRDLLCGFGLLIHDAIVKAAFDGVDGWQMFQLYDQLVECCEAVRFIQTDEAKLSAGATVRAKLRHDRSPKKVAKEFVKECWEGWRGGQQSYPSLIAFARDMLDKQPDLISTDVVSRWVRSWDKQQLH